MGRGEADPPVLYLLVAPLFTVKLSEVIVDLDCRAKLTSLTNHISHLGPDVICDVVALQESHPVDLLVGPSPEQSWKSTFGLGVAIKGSRDVAVCDCLECRGAGSPFLGDFVGGTICTGDVGY